MKQLNELIELYKSNFNLRLEITSNLDNKPVAVLYKPSPKAKFSKEKQIFCFRFLNEDRRLEYINEDYLNRVKNQEAKEKYKSDKKIKNKSDLLNVKVGDIFKDSWGYEQTNVDYFQVVAKPSSSFIVVKKINYELIDETVSNMSAYVKPLINSFKNDEELKFKLNGASFKSSSFSWANKVENIEKEKAYTSWYY